MRELPALSELINLLDLARENGYEGDFETFKLLLMERPELLPLPDKLFANGGMVNKGLGALMYDYLT
jgi:hypothetical protein